MNLESLSDKGHTLLVWDAEGEPPVGDWKAVLWSGFGKVGDSEVVSIPTLVEEDADTLRARYLDWIYELGETRINDKRLVDHLELRPGFSYWWMTLLVEKSFFKSPEIYDAIRCLALEDLKNSLQPKSVVLASSNRKLASTFKVWCANAGIDFKWRQTRVPDRQGSLKRRLYESLPYPIQAILNLVKRLWQQWPLREKSKSPDMSPAAEITFVDYLIHLNRSALMTGCFASNYWTDLIGVFNQAKAKVNWLHLYVPHHAVQTPRQARDLIAQFNHHKGGLESHSSLDGQLSFYVALAAVRDYATLVWRSLRLVGIKRHFRPEGSDLDLWLLFKSDWLQSMRGPTALWNCLALDLLEKSLSRLPRQKIGIYLQENQGWEMALIHAWRASGHGHLVGVSHGSSRYWDLRYFYHPKSYVRGGRNDLPMPNQMAVNGPVALTTYRMGGYPETKMVEVEALRYLYLLDHSEFRLPGDITERPAGVRLLVCGDVMPFVTQQMMGWLEEIAKELPANTRCTVKPHPSCEIKASDYPSLTLQVTDAPLSELFANCDVVFTSNITSAAADAYCSGIPVVQALDSNSLNMSPLRGLKGVVYVTGPAELAEALRNAEHRERVIAQPYFFLDKGLPRWRKVLGLDMANAEQTAGPTIGGDLN